MLGWLSNLWALHWGCLIGILGLGGAVLLMGHEQRLHAKEQRRERRIREEFEAYAGLDAALRGEDLRGLAKRVCRLVSRKSSFQRVALLSVDTEGRMQAAGSVGIEETTVQELQVCGESLMETGPDEVSTRLGERSFAVVLGKSATDTGCGRAIMIPVRTSAGGMRGVLAVCADGLMSLRRQTVEETIAPLEALAVKLGRAIESAEAMEQLEHAEKLAGFGIVANGVAQELSDPLTTVLEFAEQIVETAKDERIQANAKTIVNEALRMRQTMQGLVRSEHSETRIDEPVELVGLLRELAAECEDKLESRGILLAVDAEDDVPAVRGDGDALRQVLEHLLNNSAQAIDSIEGDAEREREVRVSVSHDATSVQMIVSDTGPGFEEPGRVFDPFGPGLGMGLGICYGIVHEHGGEIRAFNLHPYGAAVMVELPLGEVSARNFSGATREVA
ncbi:MAG TPA: HAMP domain-containing sensor histidine kinase [Edaphobacter sp.]|uniref:sensor histidine kinase n=1 Tax=Edaphobacter sp. TaxID=1934404 RepID=UPI002B757011|nr:HAMP domain-containing sensor histidine kinase [Edaphobacter sp.]HUZ96675.1 HAMP domain-containing sensor histidine kinase [Edaphobacter sp.]